jgi:hypothetical protein
MMLIKDIDLKSEQVAHLLFLKMLLYSNYVKYKIKLKQSNFKRDAKNILGFWYSGENSFIILIKASLHV